MIIIDKPPLHGVYLAHFGVKGMKWGQRKAAISEAVKSRMPEQETIARAKGIALGGSVAVGSILYATGKLKTTTSFVVGRGVHGAAWVGSKTLDGAITAIGTPINLASEGKLLGYVAEKIL